MSSEIILPIANFDGTGYLDLPLRTSLSAGVQFDVQGMVIDLPANQLGLVFSHGATATLGVR